ncbi:hemerythrin domain-containing protein [Kitasatospora sp. NPDC004240]
MTTTGGLLGELCAEHRALEALMRRLDAVRVDRRLPASEHLRLLAQLREVLEAHLAAEDARLYPLVRRRVPGGQALADVAGHAHTAIAELARRAADPRADAVERDRATAALLVVLRAHLANEDERLFPALRMCVPARELAGTTAGPAAVGGPPRTAPVWGLPPGTGAIGAVRDRITGHDTTGRPDGP